MPGTAARNPASVARCDRRRSLSPCSDPHAATPLKHSRPAKASRSGLHADASPGQAVCTCSLASSRDGMMPLAREAFGRAPARARFQPRRRARVSTRKVRCAAPCLRSPAGLSVIPIACVILPQKREIPLLRRPRPRHPEGLQQLHGRTVPDTRRRAGEAGNCAIPCRTRRTTFRVAADGQRRCGKAGALAQTPRPTSRTRGSGDGDPDAQRRLRRTGTSLPAADRFLC